MPGQLKTLLPVKMASLIYSSLTKITLQTYFVLDEAKLTQGSHTFCINFLFTSFHCPVLCLACGFADPSVKLRKSIFFAPFGGVKTKSLSVSFGVRFQLLITIVN